ncbi:ATP-binding protein [Ramlibacter algicola]|uniref:histidine kinase n=1 Tax=Ramlibacter algicola TaxID=2795217 RepID=A0A934Q2Z1_9BURK|nr:ATP-binding protein [Ramlibacter algicola]MBK0393297.1 histidine kinase [Ramlibacter algicola]
MKPGRSIRFRLLLGAALVLVAFLAGVGVALQRAHADSSRTDRLARLQGTVYLLLAAAEVDGQGRLVMPPSLPEPRLALPGSGLYASVAVRGQAQGWHSESTVGQQLPFPPTAEVGRWDYADASGNGRRYLSVAYSVLYEARSQPVPLVLSVLEDAAALEREVAVFERTLWAWLAGAGLFLLLSQTLLLEWALDPLRRVTREIRRIEDGEQEEITGRYPAEIAALTDNLNTLVRQERERQSRYREALSYLAHSLKTPLAVLRTALGQPATLGTAVEEQVQRMDAIVQHQLGRGAASGATRFAPAIALAPIAQRVRESLEKVHAARNLRFAIDCPPNLRWRIDEGDAFEVFGNLLDNAAKWARSRITARVRRDGSRLLVRVEDDGPGFGDDPQAMLQMHVRGDETVPGHGVGLAIVRDIVASHHGQIALSRSALGGAQVDIALPQP